MLSRKRTDAAWIALVEEALRPHAWRRMTVQAVARRLVEVLDGETVPTDDHRVWMVADALLRCRWRGLTAAGLARHAEAALDLWCSSSRRLDAELAWLLEATD